MKDILNIYLILREALKKTVFLGMIPKPADYHLPPSLGTFRNKNLNFAQIRITNVNFVAKNNGHQNFT